MIPCTGTRFEDYGAIKVQFLNSYYQKNLAIVSAQAGERDA